MILRTFLNYTFAYDIQVLSSEVHNKVIFSAIRKYSGNSVAPGSVITYTDVDVNLKNGLEPETGEFHAPVSGVYSFTFSGRGDDKDEDDNIWVYKNNLRYLLIRDSFNAQREAIYRKNLSYVWTMKLQAGDVIKLKLMNDENGLYVDSDEFIFFTGQLLHAQ